MEQYLKKLPPDIQASFIQSRLAFRKAQVLNDGIELCANRTASKDHDGKPKLPVFCEAMGCDGRGKESLCERFVGDEKW